MLNKSKIIALIDSISKDNAIQYGNLQIENVTANPAGTAFRFTFDGGSTIDIPFSAFSFMLTPNYSTTTGIAANSVDKSKLLKNNTDNNFYDGSYYLNRINHTGYDPANKVTVDKTSMSENLISFTGTTLQDFIDWIDSFNQFSNGTIYIGKKETANSFKMIKENTFLNVYRYSITNSQYELIGTFGDSIESDRFILNSWDGRITLKIQIIH
jgi:hypothetical protein